MQDDTFPAAEKILSDIENIIKKKKLFLKSFEIVPAEDNENRSPVFYQEDNLGLASWCVQPLYCYAYKHLLDLRRNHHREDPRTVARWLLGALLLNPHVITFWNMRRELVRSHRLDAYEELFLIRVVLYHKPKCFEAFSYRRWLLSRFIDIEKSKCCSYDPESANSPLCAELKLIETCADRYANNYHAWSHRRYLQTLRESRNLLHPTLNSEWKSTLDWCKMHVSDHSAHSYRQYLLGKCVWETVPSIIPKKISWNSCVDSTSSSYSTCLEEHLFPYIDSGVVSGRQKMLLRNCRDVVSNKTKLNRNLLRYYLRALSYWAEECKINEQLILKYDCHEVLWCHRKFLASLLAHLVVLLAKYSRYKEEEYLDARHHDRSLMIFTRERYQHEQNILQNNELVIDAHMLLLDAFRAGNFRITTLAAERNVHENVFVQRFLKILGVLGLESSM